MNVYLHANSKLLFHHVANVKCTPKDRNYAENCLFLEIFLPYLIKYVPIDIIYVLTLVMSGILS